MRSELLNAWVAVVSDGRPANVERMNELIGPATWYVPDDQLEDYKDAGAPAVVPDGRWPGKRNKALEDAFSQRLECLQLDDDLKALTIAVPDNGRLMPREVGIATVVSILRSALRQTRFRLAGKSPTANPFYTRQEKPITTGFVIAQMMLVRDSSPRFDDALLIKHDYDFTLQHVKAYGGVARCDHVLCPFDYGKAAGGCQSFRDDKVEAHEVEYLVKKWGSRVVRPHPRRPGQVILKIPRPKRAR
jgi:hypothetical protein